MATTPIYQAADTQNSTGGTTVTINKPTNLNAGDALIAHVGGAAVSGTWTPPVGWTTVTNNLNSGGANFPTTGMFWKVAGGSEPSSYSFTFSVATNVAGEIMRVTGADTTTPVDSSSTSSNTSSSSTVAMGTISPTLQNNLIMLFANTANSGPGAYSCTNVTSFSNGYSITIPSTGGQLNMAYGVSTASGSATAQGTSFGNSSSNGIALSIVPLNIVTPSLFAGATFSIFAITQVIKSILPTAIADMFGLFTPTTSNSDSKWTRQQKNTDTWSKQSKS